jgi:glycolate oxidase
VRLLRVPESVQTLLADFPSIAAAGDVVSDVVAAGIVPAAIEMMDTLAIEAAEEAVHAGYTVGVPAALIVELDGPRRGVRRPVRAGQGDLREARLHPAAHRGLRRRAGGDLARVARRRSRPVGRISPDYFVQDGVVPRTRLGRGARPDRRDGRRGRAAGGQRLPRGRRQPAPARALQRRRGRDGAGRAPLRRIAELCVEMGGSLSGEHGIGTDKACSMPKMFSEDDMAVMRRVRAAFDRWAVQPGQGVPHPAAVRRAPWQVRAPSVGGVRHHRAAVTEVER